MRSRITKEVLFSVVDARCVVIDVKGYFVYGRIVYDRLLWNNSVLVVIGGWNRKYTFVLYRYVVFFLLL